MLRNCNKTWENTFTVWALFDSTKEIILCLVPIGMFTHKIFFKTIFFPCLFFSLFFFSKLNRSLSLSLTSIYLFIFITEGSLNSSLPLWHFFILLFISCEVSWALTSLKSNFVVFYGKWLTVLETMLFVGQTTAFTLLGICTELLPYWLLFLLLSVLSFVFLPTAMYLLFLKWMHFVCNPLCSFGAQLGI